MKFTALITLAAFAAGAAAQTAYYSSELDETCNLGEDGNAINCVPGRTPGAVQVDDDVLYEGQSVPRDLEALDRRSWTCSGWFAGFKCRTKCKWIHGRPCGGRCDTGWCYCSAKC